MTTPSTTVPESDSRAPDSPAAGPPVRSTDGLDIHPLVPAAGHGDPIGHVTFLTLASIVLLLSLVLHIRGEEQVILPGWGVPLPPFCSFKRMFGLDCPGCGLTRCFISLAHGDFPRAWQFNPAGIFFFAVVAAQIPFRGWQLWRLRSGQRSIELGWWGHSVLLLLVALLIGQWLVRVVDRFL